MQKHRKKFMRAQGLHIFVARLSRMMFESVGVFHTPDLTMNAAPKLLSAACRGAHTAAHE